MREYIWLNDMPVAVVDNVNTTPVIYYVQVDHLLRPARMTDASANWVWDVIFTPFGTTAYINQNPTVMNIRFPGQWFQLETGLAYNWHRHYDATTGRYVQPDPMGLAALLSGGPARYSYVRSSPLAYVDPQGLAVIDPETPKEYEERHTLGQTTDEEDARHGSGIDPMKMPLAVPNPFGIPPEYTPSPSKGGIGVIYCDPTDPAKNWNKVRLMPGDPSSPFAEQQVPYVMDLRNGQYRDVNGNPVPRQSPESHIPQSIYRY